MGRVCVAEGADWGDGRWQQRVVAVAKKRRRWCRLRWDSVWSR